MLCFSMLLLFFKRKTAYEMRISDWSSDVCSSDLHDACRHAADRHAEEPRHGVGEGEGPGQGGGDGKAQADEARRVVEKGFAFQNVHHALRHADILRDRDRKSVV